MKRYGNKFMFTHLDEGIYDYIELHKVYTDYEDYDGDHVFKDESSALIWVSPHSSNFNKYGKRIDWINCNFISYYEAIKSL